MEQMAILRFGREDCIMAMALTRDERLLLRYLASGRSLEEIAATLNWPIQVVRWTCTHPLIAWVLDETRSQYPPGRLPQGRVEVSQGRAILDYMLNRVQRIERRGS
jgi:hypothetical protein